MDATVKDNWIAALESGEYKQAQHNLRVGDSYCCLGVLCDLYKKEQEAVGNVGTCQWKEDEYDNVHRFHTSELEWEDAVPDSTVLKWAGLIGHDWNGLAELNDDGHTFDQIAAIIANDF